MGCMALSDPSPDPHEALRVNLVVFRAKNGLSQAKLARRTGVSRAIISRA